MITRCITQEPRQRPTADELTRILMAMDVSTPPVVTPGRHRVSDPFAPPALAPQALAPATPEPAPVAALPARPRRWSRRAVLGLGGGVGVLAVTGGVAAFTGVFDRGPAAATWRPAPTPTARVAGAILGQYDSGAGAPIGGPGRDVIDQRIVVDGDGRLVTANGPHISARKPGGPPLWTRSMPAGIVGTWRWGDYGVLATDGRQLWLLDTGSGGATMFAKDIVADETAEVARAGGPTDHAPVAVGQVVVGGDRAFVSLGTATVAFNRDGKRLWRHPRPAPGASSAAAIPVAADADHFVAQDVSSGSALVSMYEAESGDWLWSSTYAPSTAPPPPGGPEGPEADPTWQRSEGRIAGKYVLVRSGSTIQVLDLATGGTGLNVASKLPVTAIEIVDGLALVAAERLYAYDLATGAIAWQAPPRGARIAVSTVPRGVIAAADGMVLGLDTGGTQLWQTKLPTTAPVDVVVVNPHVAYVLLQAPEPPGPGQPPPPPTGPDVVVIALDTVS